MTNPMQAPNVGPAGKDFGGKEPAHTVTIDNYDGRGVVHFLSVLTDTEMEEHGGLFGDDYEYSVRKVKAHVKKYYGDHTLVKKFHNKRFGGGIVFDLPYNDIRVICSILSEQEGIVK